MKNLELQNSVYKTHIKAFKSWLATLGYSPGTVYNMPHAVKEFLHYLELQNNFNYTVDSELIASYFKNLSQRGNKRRSGGLSFGYLEKHRTALNRYFEYLRRIYQIVIAVQFPYIPKQKKVPQVLTHKEVELLFKTCKDDAFGKRDKAMLTLYYGCGLRKIEGIRLDVEDIDLNRRLVFIKKSKTHKQRYVPISKKGVKMIEDYLFSARELLLPKDNNEAAFLISSKGNRMSSELPVYALKQLIEKTENSTLKQKNISLHILRHSIATHLMQSGMSLENIALFLGHQSLDSTQIYTHLATTL